VFANTKKKKKKGPTGVRKEERVGGEARGEKGNLPRGELGGKRTGAGDRREGGISTGGVQGERVGLEGKIYACSSDRFPCRERGAEGLVKRRRGVDGGGTTRKAGHHVREKTAFV